MRIRLESNEAGDVPRWMAEAVLEYRCPERREYLLGLMVRKFCQGLKGPPTWAWHCLLSGETPYTVHRGAVLFEVADPGRN